MANEPMRLQVTLFAAARQLAGTESVSLQVSPESRAADVLDALGRQIPDLVELLPACRLAVDCQYVGPDAAVGADQELALIPPVSGG